MTGDDDAAGPPAAWGNQLQEASERAFDRQVELFGRFLAAGAGSLHGLAAMQPGTATFKARVQSGGRISIPDAEREALGIGEGDLVQAIVVPVDRSSDIDRRSDRDS